ncbi:MAG: hypothetical protein HY722_11465 [Planctomycetes bacterium]|nr:hypothetical protein [Planctomycetota bacterium]
MAEDPTPPARPRRLWLRRLFLFSFLFVGLLMAAVFFAPSLLGGVIRDQAVQAANASLNGTAAIGQVSVSTASGVEVRDVAVKDAGGEEVVSLGGLTVRWSLAPALGGTAVVDEVLLERPAILVRRRADGSLNLAGLVRPSAEAPAPKALEPSGPVELPLDVQVKGVRIQGASLRIVDEASGLDASVQGLDLVLGPVNLGRRLVLSELLALAVKGTLAGAAAGSFSVDVKVDPGADLNAPDKLPYHATVKLQGVDLSVARPFAQGLSELAGTLGLEVQVDGVAGEASKAHVTLSLQGLRAAGEAVGPAPAALESLAVDLVARADLKTSRIDLDSLKVATPFETLSLSGSVAGFDGEAPQVALDLKSVTDLARLRSDLGAVLGLAEDLRVGGTLDTAWTVSGSAKGPLEVKGELGLAGFSASGAGIQEPVAAGLDLRADVGLDPTAHRVEVRTLELATLREGATSAFATVSAHGTVSDYARTPVPPMALDTKVDLDLAELTRVAGALLPDGLRLGGSVHVGVEARPGETETAVAVKTTVNVQSLAASGGPFADTPLEGEDLELACEVSADVQERGQTIRVPSLTARGSFVTAIVRDVSVVVEEGRSIPRVRATGEVVADVDRLGRLGRALLPEGMTVAGRVPVSFHAEEAEDGRTRVLFDVGATGLAASGGPVGERPFELERLDVHADALVDMEKQSVSLAELTLRTSPLSVTARGTFDGEGRAVDLEASVDADLADGARRGAAFLPEGLAVAGGRLQTNLRASGPLEGDLDYAVDVTLRGLDASGGPLGEARVQEESIALSARGQANTSTSQATSQVVLAVGSPAGPAEPAVHRVDATALVAWAEGADRLEARLRVASDLAEAARRYAALLALPEGLAIDGARLALEAEAAGSFQRVRAQAVKVALEGVNVRGGPLGDAPLVLERALVELPEAEVDLTDGASSAAVPLVRVTVDRLLELNARASVADLTGGSPRLDASVTGGVDLSDLAARRLAMLPPELGTGGRARFEARSEGVPEDLSFHAVLDAGDSAVSWSPTTPDATTGEPVTSTLFSKPEGAPTRVTVQGAMSKAEGLSADGMVELGRSVIVYEARLDGQFKRAEASLSTTSPLDLEELCAWLPGQAEKAISGTVALDGISVVLPLDAEDVVTAMEARGAVQLTEVRMEENVVESLTVPVELAGGVFRTDVAGRVNDGDLAARAESDLGAEAVSWDAALTLSGVKVSREILSLLKYVNPMLAFVPDTAGFSSRFSLEARLAQRGAATSVVEGRSVTVPNISTVGDAPARLSVTDVGVGSSVLLELIACSKGETLSEFQMDSYEQTFQIQDGWILNEGLQGNGQGVDMKVRGRTSLGGDLDQRVEAGPIAQDRQVREFLEKYPDIDTSVALTGTVTSPRLGLRETLQRVALEVAKRKAAEEAGRLIDKGLEGGLDGLLGGKKKKK